MDINALAVGQYVFIRSGRYSDWGKVLEITPTGVCVEHIFEEPTPEWTPHDRAIYFDKNGIACESCDYKGGFVEGSKIPGTKYGPWKLYARPKEAGLTIRPGSDPRPYF